MRPAVEAADTGGAAQSRGRRLPRVRKPDTVLPLGPVDVEALRAQVDRLPDALWRREDRFKPNRFSCFHHTRHIVFRFIPRNRDPRAFYSEPIWRIWRRWLLPVMAPAAAVYGYAGPIYPKVMLARLEAGQRIDPHVDGAGSNPCVHKVHVPLRTNPQAVLRVQDREVHLTAGQAWEVNNLVTHSAFNGGEEDRIHLVFEVYDDPEGAP